MRTKLNNRRLGGPAVPETRKMKEIVISTAIGIAVVVVPIARARADGPRLIRIQSIATVKLGAATFGPVGTNCSANAGGPDCTFVAEGFSTSSRTDPFGPSTGTGSATLLFGLNGAFLTPSGTHDSAGNPTGFCAPEVATETDTYRDGSTLTENFRQTICCAGEQC